MDLRNLKLLVVQSTPFCNLDCSYCYLPDRINSKKMSTNLFREVCDFISSASHLPERLNIVWHAGEPTALGVDYYEEMLLVARDVFKEKTKICFGFQTNGTLITEKWCDFLIRSESIISFSIDGPGWYHDQRRKYRNGSGSFDASMHGLKLAQGSGLETPIISVISPSILQNPHEFLEFCAASGAKRFGLNIEEIEGAHKFSELYSSQTEFHYMNFIRTLAEKSRDMDISFREIDDARKSISSSGHIMNSEVEPFNIINIDYTGRISIFSPELITDTAFRAKYHLPNIHGSSLEEIVSNDVIQRLTSEVSQGVAKCKEDCRYFNHCGGGAPSNKFSETGRLDVSKTNYCGFKKRLLLNAVLEELEAFSEKA